MNWDDLLGKNSPKMTLSELGDWKLQPKRLDRHVDRLANQIDQA